MASEKTKYKLNTRDHVIAKLEQGLGVSIPWQGLVENYLNGNIGICLDFHARFPASEGKAQDATLVFYKAACGDRDTAPCDPGRQADPRCGHDPIFADMESSVSVDSGEVVERPNRETMPRLVWPNVRSVVRLYTFDEGLRLRFHVPNLPSGLIKVVGRVSDDEFDVVRIGGRIVPGLENGRFVCEGIKTGAELIEEFSKHDAEDGQDGIVAGNDPHDRVPVVCYLYRGGIGFNVTEVGPPLGQFFSVRVCPLDTLPAIGEWHDRDSTRSGLGSTACESESNLPGYLPARWP